MSRGVVGSWPLRGAVTVSVIHGLWFLAKWWSCWLQGSHIRSEQSTGNGYKISSPE